VKLIFLMGLTGVGKSTAVSALQRSGVPLTLLPNRRALTDELIIPEMQRAAGRPVQAVTDRLERFELTRRYRERYPGGMVHALGHYLEGRHLETHPGEGQGTVVFDNLRGLDEARAATQTFPGARFVLLDAPPLVRLLRLVGRHDRFDQVAATRLENSSFAKQLRALDGLEAVFDASELARLEARGVPEGDLLKAVRIILGETRNYDMAAAAAYLRDVKDARSFLQLDTAAIPVDEVQARIQGWL
jgi:hypothetical protein